MSESKAKAEPLLEPEEEREFNASPWRWVVLFAYCILPVVQNIAYLVYSTVVQRTADFYHVSNNSVIFLANLANIMLVPSMLIMMPLPTIFSLKVTVQITGVIIGAAGFLRLLATGPGHFGEMIFAQGVNGIPGPILMNIPPLLSATWFPPRERVAATSIAFVAQSFGMGLGFLLGPWIVTSPAKIQRLNEVLAVLGALVVLVVLAFPHKPAPPSASAATKKHSFWAGLKILIFHRSYLFLAAIASFALGVPGAWTGLINNYLTCSDIGFTDKQVGWMGFSSIVAGTLVGAVVGVAVDRFRLSLRHTAAVLIGLGAVALAAFVVEVYTIGHPPRFWVVFFAVLFVGISANSIGPMLIEMAADLTYPVSEETSATMISTGYAVVSVTCMTVGGSIDASVANTAFAVMLVAAAVGVFFVSDVSERRAVDELGGAGGGDELGAAEGSCS
jgi:FLVCR family MFS transporter